MFLDSLPDAPDLLDAGTVALSTRGIAEKAQAAMSSIWAHVVVATEDARTAKSARRRVAKIQTR